MEGLEPPKAEPESAVLPLHYIPITMTRRKYMIYIFVAIGFVKFLKKSSVLLEGRYSGRSR